jgi:hypothetical protein
VVHSHEEKGIVERASKEIIRHLRNTMLEKNEQRRMIYLLTFGAANFECHKAVCSCVINTPELNLNEGVSFPHSYDSTSLVVFSE